MLCSTCQLVVGQSRVKLLGFPVGGTTLKKDPLPSENFAHAITLLRAAFQESGLGHTNQYWTPDTHPCPDSNHPEQ
jgi:hypothetical protein